MRCIVINLPGSQERRKFINYQFARVGLDYELWTAVDWRDMTEEDRKQADQEGRRRRGLRPMEEPSIACLLSHLSILRHLSEESNDGVAAIFEDDAILDPALPSVLDELEMNTHKFDIVTFERRGSKPYFPVYDLVSSEHSIGRLKYHDRGACGYVITKSAASHILECRSFLSHWEIDQLIPRFWDNGLENVLYIDPPVVRHNGRLPSYLEDARIKARLEHRRLLRRNPILASRRAYDGIDRAVRRWFRFRELRRRDRHAILERAPARTTGPGLNPREGGFS